MAKRTMYLARWRVMSSTRETVQVLQLTMKERDQVRRRLGRAERDGYLYGWKVWKPNRRDVLDADGFFRKMKRDFPVRS